MKGKIFTKVKEKAKEELLNKLRGVLKEAAEGDASELIATAVEAVVIGGIAVFGGKLILQLIPKRVIHEIVFKI
jgi:hypothetical protein